MNTALICGLIILVVLVVLLVAGVPIAVALGISSVCAILPIMDTGVAVLTGAQRIFSGISVFSLLAIPFFILAGNLMNKGGIAVRLINLAKVVTWRACADKRTGKHALWRDLWIRYGGCFCNGLDYRADRKGRGL